VEGLLQQKKKRKEQEKEGWKNRKEEQKLQQELEGRRRSEVSRHQSSFQQFTHSPNVGYGYCDKKGLKIIYSWRRSSLKTKSG